MERKKRFSKSNSKKENLMRNTLLSWTLRQGAAALLCSFLLIFSWQTAWSNPPANITPVLANIKSVPAKIKSVPANIKSVPAKIDVVPAKIESVPALTGAIEGSTAHITVNLLDSANQPAVAKKDIAIQVESRSPSGATETSTVVVKAGETSGVVELPTKEAGPVTVGATTRELASGGSVLNVRQNVQKTEASPTPVPLATLAPAPPASPSSTASVGNAFRLRAMPRAAVGRARSVMAAPSGTPLPPNVPAERPPSVVEKAWNPDLTFLYVPERKIWADKKDAATIYALLPPDELAPWKMFVYMISSEGFLAPEALVIPKGQN